jgi:hypothetical protein
MDPSGFFEEPVTEELAPGYSKVVSHPMCFQARIVLSSATSLQAANGGDALCHPPAIHM